MTAQMKSIGILSGSHLCRNPRVQKEAWALARAGYDVEILGAWTDPVLKAEDLSLLEGSQVRFTPVLEVNQPRLWTRMRWILARALASYSRRWPRWVPAESAWRLGVSANALWGAAMRRSADLWIAHSGPGLWAARQLLEAGSRVGVDMEDWFSEDLPPEAQVARASEQLANLERVVHGRGMHSTCPSKAMSAALEIAYGRAAPGVVYNAFPWSGRRVMDSKTKDREQLRRPSIHWYSQTLGPGRGLEDLLAALPFLANDAEVHLRGQPARGFDAWLRERIPAGWGDRLHFHRLVSNQELLSRISEHDIGFAGEIKSRRSHDLTVSNKILHYLLAGLAVVASDTVGQLEVASQAPEAVQIYPSGDPRRLAEVLDRLLDSPERLKSAKAAALSAAEGVFCWERQEPVLLRSVESALRSQGPLQ